MGLFEYYFKRICLVLFPLTLICLIFLGCSGNFYKSIPVKDIKIEKEYKESCGHITREVSFVGVENNIKYKISYHGNEGCYQELINTHIYTEENTLSITLSVISTIFSFIGFLSFLLTVLTDEEWYSDENQVRINNLNVGLILHLLLFFGYKKEVLDKIFKDYKSLSFRNKSSGWYGWSYIKKKYNEIDQEK